MKITNEICWLFGFIKPRKTKKGIGIHGNLELQQKFLKKVLELELIKPEKILIEKDRISFRHIKLENLLKKMEKKKFEIFSRKNKATCYFLRGIYESCGEGNKLKNINLSDQMLIERLGFLTKRIGKDIYIINFNSFQEFLKKF
jgi:HD-GYP domain-containing protein (c-di-GMP phosphodiesterase class II)